MKKYKYPKNEFLKSKTLEKQLVFTNSVVNIICPQKTFIDGHFILTTTRYVEFVENLTPEEMVSIFSVLNFLVSTLKLKNKKMNGFDFLVNRGIQAGQHVPHAHFHFIPRYSDEKFDNIFSAINDPSKYNLSETNLKERVSHYKEYLPISFEKIKKEQNKLPATHDVSEKKSDKNVVHSGKLMDLVFPDNSNVKNNFLITPRGFIENLSELNEAEIIEILNLIKKITSTFLRKRQGVFTGYNLIINNRNDEYNNLKEFNIRYVPRFKDETSNPLKIISDTSKVKIIPEEERVGIINSHREFFQKR